MTGFAEFREKWNAFWDDVRTTMAPVDRVVGVIRDVFSFIFRWIYRLRGILISIPVAIAAWKLALYNKVNLPAEVGLNLLSNGEFAQMIPLQSAVMVPFFITIGCLAMVLCSRKILYPWAISIFTLSIPLLLLLTNNMPALMDLFALLKNFFTAA